MKPDTEHDANPPVQPIDSRIHELGFEHDTTTHGTALVDAVQQPSSEPVRLGAAFRVFLIVLLFGLASMAYTLITFREEDEAGFAELFRWIYLALAAPVVVVGAVGALVTYLRYVMKSRQATPGAGSVAPRVGRTPMSSGGESELPVALPRSLYVFFGLWVLATVLPVLFLLFGSTALAVLFPYPDLLFTVALIGVWGALWLVGCTGTIVTLVVAARKHSQEGVDIYPRGHQRLITIMSVILFFLPSLPTLFVMLLE